MAESVVKTLQRIMQICSTVIIYQIVTFSPIFHAAYASAAEDTVVFGDVSWLALREFVGQKDVGFNIVMDDQVKDGCWATPQAVNAAIELELNRSNIKVAPGMPGLGVDITVMALGMQVAEGYCVVSYSFKVSRMIFDRFLGAMGITSAPIWSAEGILTGPKADIGIRLKNQYIEATQSFILAIDSKSKEILDTIREKAQGDAKVFWDGYKLK